MIEPEERRGEERRGVGGRRRRRERWELNGSRTSALTHPRYQKRTTSKKKKKCFWEKENKSE